MEGLGTAKRKLTHDKVPSRTELLVFLFIMSRTFVSSPQNSLLGKKEGREERDSLSLRPECLAVFLWLTRTCFSLPRQVGNTQPHSGHRRVCPRFCLHAAWQPSQWAHRIAMATNIVDKALAAPLWDFFGVHLMPQLIVDVRSSNLKSNRNLFSQPRFCFVPPFKK